MTTEQARSGDSSAAAGGGRHRLGRTLSPPPTVDGGGAAPGGSASGGSDLGRTASRGVLVTLGGQWSRTLLQLASTVTLARLLAPSDFGLLAMVTAIVGVADLLRDFGLSGAIVQVKVITDRLWSSLLWLSAALGTVAMVVVAACAPLIAALYGEPDLVVLTLALSPALLLNGLSMPMQTKLQRELAFRTLATIDVVSMLVGVVVSISSAALGFGVWSLVLMSGSASVYRIVALWRAAKPRFGRPHIAREVLPLVTTGGSIFGVQLLNYAARNLDNVLVGRAAGAAVLGYYGRAYALLMLPLSQLNGPLARVALPVLSQLQDQPERYRRYVRTSLKVIGYLTFPTFAIAAAVAHPLVELLLGPQWTMTADIFQLLAISGVASALGSVNGWLYITLGRAHRQLVFSVVTRPIVIGSYVVGLWWNGVNGLALAYGIVTLVMLVPGFHFAIKGTFVTWKDMVRPVVGPALLVPLVFLAASAGVSALDGPAAVQLVLGGVAGLVPVAVAYLVPAVRADMQELVGFARRVRG